MTKNSEISYFMQLFEKINSVLSGVALPVILISVGIYLAVKLRFFYLLHPIRFAKDLKSAAKGGGTSPAKALSIALAGTLGVGNISGVAAAICAGGAGSVFWMWISAFAAMSVKYAEVYLAVRYRRRKKDKSGKEEFYGGAMYYIKEGMSAHIGKRASSLLASVFAVLLVVNSVVTGNIVQINAVSSVCAAFPRILCGAAVGLCVLAVVAGGAKRIGDFTFLVIPFLSAVYIALSLYIIFTNISEVPTAFEKIIGGAFSLKAAGGGVLGLGVSRAVRFGVTRGIFSNEAGCGTAPTSHASANTKSPHHQGCFGIFEVFCDTVVLCTMTAVVIIMADLENLDGIPLSVASFGLFCGRAGEYIIGGSVVVFALATIICQEYYGIEALGYFGASKAARNIYIALSFCATLVGSVISDGAMWLAADFVIAVMTVINTLCVFVMSDEIKREYKGKNGKRENKENKEARRI